MSLPEAMLWEALRGEKLGFRARRQHPIGPFTVDYYVRQAALVIEVDGESHNRGDRPERDFARDSYLVRKGYRVLRFAASDVMNNLEGVIAVISERVANPLHHPSDGPPPHAGEDNG